MGIKRFFQSIGDFFWTLLVFFGYMILWLFAIMFIVAFSMAIFKLPTDSLPEEFLFVILFVDIIISSYITNRAYKKRTYKRSENKEDVIQELKTHRRSHPILKPAVEPIIEPILPSQKNPVQNSKIIYHQKEKTDNYIFSSRNEELLKYGGIDYELLNIDLMEGHDFEYWCAGLLRKIGFTHVEVTPGSNDQGVDILAQKDGIKYAIQCKRYSHDLGNTPVQEVHAGKAMYNCHVGVVLTNQNFTTGAKQLAQATGVLLWDRDWIKSHLVSTDNSISTQRSFSLYEDEMLPAAVDIILETGQASVSMIQRRLMLGYARAARIIDEMEEKGMVGPFQGSKPRAILITKEQWNNMKEG